MICKKILVVDDEKSIRECISDLLEFEGYSVIAVRNGQEALDYLKSLTSENFPGIIMLDLMMPVMDGLTFLKEIKGKHTEFYDIPVVVISAAHVSGANTSFLDYAVEKLSKPIGFDEINRVVKQYCGTPLKSHF